jgi:hypothetical protein
LETAHSCSRTLASRSYTSGNNGRRAGGSSSNGRADRASALPESTRIPSDRGDDEVEEDGSDDEGRSDIDGDAADAVQRKKVEEGAFEFEDADEGDEGSEEDTWKQFREVNADEDDDRDDLDAKVPEHRYALPKEVRREALEAAKLPIASEAGASAPVSQKHALVQNGDNRCDLSFISNSRTKSATCSPLALVNTQEACSVIEESWHLWAGWGCCRTPHASVGTC